VQNLQRTIADEVRDVIEAVGGEPSKVGAFREVLVKHWTSRWSGRYVPKDTYPGIPDHTDLDWIAAELNDQPRKRLGSPKLIELIKNLLLQ
jgi:hypothetical protein